MSRLSLSLVACAALWAAACKPAAPQIVDQTVQVGCGMCRFQVPQPTCYWAMKLDGKVLPVRGDVLPHDHENHAPDGMCNVTRDAIVSGTVYETYFLATRFDLQPVEPAANPEFGTDDAH